MSSFVAFSISLSPFQLPYSLLSPWRQHVYIDGNGRTAYFFNDEDIMDWLQNHLRTSAPSKSKFENFPRITCDNLTVLLQQSLFIRGFERNPSTIVVCPGDPVICELIKLLGHCPNLKLTLALFPHHIYGDSWLLEMIDSVLATAAQFCTSENLKINVHGLSSSVFRQIMFRSSPSTWTHVLPYLRKLDLEPWSRYWEADVDYEQVKFGIRDGFKNRIPRVSALH